MKKQSLRQSFRKTDPVRLENRRRTRLQRKLREAIIEGDAPQVRQCLAAGASFALFDDSRQSPLFVAARYDKPEIARILLQAGADPNDEMSAHTPLMMTRCADTAKILLDHGADVSRRSPNGFSALYFACAGPANLSLTAVLLTAGADAHDTDAEGRTLLMCCRCPSTGALLLAHGADLHAKDKEGRTALEIVLTQEDVDYTRFLLASGAPASAIGSDGRPLLLNALSNRLLTGLLLEHGADPDATAPEGLSALHIAAGAGDADSLRLLLQHGANPYVLDSKNRRPRDLAQERIDFPTDDRWPLRREAIRMLEAAEREWVVKAMTTPRDLSTMPQMTLRRRGTQGP